MRRKINLLECLVGWICGKKTNGSGYFLSKLAKIFSPQIEEKTRTKLLDQNTLIHPCAQFRMTLLFSSSSSSSSSSSFFSFIYFCLFLLTYLFGLFVVALCVWVWGGGGEIIFNVIKLNKGNTQLLLLATTVFFFFWESKWCFFFWVNVASLFLINIGLKKKKN